ncbi:MAG: hypothetical protein E6005_09990 [Peptostreptococcus sp.]|uniref:hypothetical protein n=1 Tax=Peptostreptococcus TaxID=1257 RepID=UPI001D0996F9|nr:MULTISPECIES: hypothetical protein [Peptostreptococcus]MDU5981636.1 hypothetical protein [Eggerthella sp.]MCB6982622.1 hypothetical protein [Peptostreptococcus anaerobius]MCQ5150678.1 hypothetical protein [Peptostreptococcus anaerobius]MDB8851479.1 hypothetical protein [Peptostreptococcus anaerobius]MDU5682150.1 hypothetical protein [Peptostreptococcus sp.]
MIYQAIFERMLIGDITAYKTAIDTFMLGISSVFSELALVKKNSLDVNFLFSFLDLPKRRDLVDIKNKVSISTIDTIELKNVHFKYSEKMNIP